MNTKLQTHSAVTKFLGCRALDAGANLPSKLYRYRSAATPYFSDELARLLAHNEIFYPSRAQLNDPFDCLPLMERGVDYQAFKRYLLPIIIRMLLSDVAGFQRRGLLTKGGSSDPKKVLKKLSKTPAWQKSLYDRGFLSFMREELVDKVGVLSLTTNNQNLPMWSNYASTHNGMCIELTDFAHGVMGKVPMPVAYSDERSVFDYRGFICYLIASKDPSLAFDIPPASQRWLGDSFSQFSFTERKSTAWSYEEEYRLVSFQTGGKYHGLSQLKLSAIYIGAKVPVEMRDKIIEMARRKRPGLPLYAMHFNESTYSLISQEVT